jgi:hypothetical protein
VDADDWLDATSLQKILRCLDNLENNGELPDMFLANYVYEKPSANKRKVMRYGKALPQDRIFNWSEIGRFRISQYILMHSVMYKANMLRNMDFALPEHTFYVDNIFVYVPLPHVQTLYYMDVNLYRYYIGREGQSVSESVMAGRIDQQLAITRVMIDAWDLARDVHEPRLQKYMQGYLAMMMCICDVFLLINGNDVECKRDAIWDYLKMNNAGVYDKVRHSMLARGTTLNGNAGKAITLAGYRIASKLFGFN